MRNLSGKSAWAACIVMALTSAIPSRAADLLVGDARRINFHARIKQGNPPLIGNHTLTFQIYDDPVNPVALPGGGPYVVNVNVPSQDNSTVNLVVPTSGSGLPSSLFTGGARYLGVSIDDNAELTPRFQLAMAAYSMRTNFVGNEELIDDVDLGNATTTGSLRVFRSGSAMPVMTLIGNSAQMHTSSPSGVETMNAGSGVNGGGFVILRQDNGSLGLQLDGFVPGQGGVIVGRTPSPLSSRSYELLGSDGDGAGRFTLYNGAADPGQERVRIDADGIGGGAGINLWNDANVETVRIDSDATQSAGLIAVRNSVGTATVGIQGSGGDNAGFIRVRNAANQDAIILDASDEGGKGRVIADIVEIKGGADLSERFEIRGPDHLLPQSGMVVSIDPTQPGQLVVSHEPHDRKVAGIISGAGGVRPGLLIGQDGSIADGRHPVALSGRVYCMVDADRGAVQPGDLLTTSATAGHAMKVLDHTAAQGAILGKAMTGLSAGQGLVLVLVTLQ